MKHLNETLSWKLSCCVDRPEKLWDLCIDLGFGHREILKEYEKGNRNISLIFRKFLQTAFMKNGDNFDKRVEQAFTAAGLGFVFFTVITENEDGKETSRRSLLEDRNPMP